MHHLPNIRSPLYKEPFPQSIDDIAECDRTVTGIANFSDDVLRAMNEAKVTVSAFIDLRKAFDTVNHSLLSQKLRHMGVGGMFLDWRQVI